MYKRQVAAHKVHAHLFACGIQCLGKVHGVCIGAGTCLLYTSRFCLQLYPADAALTASEAELAALADADTRRVELEAEAARLAQREKMCIRDRNSRMRFMASVRCSTL